MGVRLVFLTFLLCVPLVTSTNQEELAAWFKENSEIFVILKHWNELPLVSTAWKRIKDSPPIVSSRNSIQKGFDSLINFCDCGRKSVSSVSLVSTANDGSCSGKNCSVSVTRTPEITDINKTKETAALEERVNQLEATLLRLNESVKSSQTSRTSSETKTVIDDETLKTPVNISANDLKAFIADHKEEQRWFRSQLIPLNYLFEKLKVIEDDIKEIQEVLEVKKKNIPSEVLNITQKSVGNSDEIFSDLKFQIERVDSLGKNFTAEIANMSRVVRALSEEFYITKEEVANLTAKVVELQTKPITSANATDEEEYCPEKLDDMTPCSEIGDSCYCFSKQQKNWTAAVDFCLNKNMYLLSLETEKETELVTKYINQSDLPKDFYWTSGNDEAEEGIWIWTASEINVTHTNWRQQQPDGGTKENCLYLHGRDDFKWGDWLCSLSQYFVCEW